MEQSPRYFKATKLRLDPLLLSFVRNDELPGCVNQGKLHCLEVNDLLKLEDIRPELLDEFIKTMVQLLEVSRFSLEELRLRNCPKETLKAVYAGLAKECRLRHIRVDLDPVHFKDVILPKVPTVPVGLALVTHLEVTLVFRKDLLLRCCNELHLSALNSLSVINDDPYMPNGVIQPEELGVGCWRVLAQLETFRCLSYNLFTKVLVEMLQHCRKLQCLAISSSCISIECIEQIVAMKGLKDLQLTMHGRFRKLGRNLPVLQPPNLEHLHLSADIGIRLGKQMPNIKSMVLEGLHIHSCLKATLSEIVNIDSIGGQWLSKLSFVCVTLDREANEWLGSLTIGLLSFQRCKIDGSLLDVLAKPASRRMILRIVMKDCTLIFQAGQP